MKRRPFIIGKVIKHLFSIDPCPYVAIYLTNRFHAAVRLSSNRSQMTSKYGKNKKVAHKPQASVSPMIRKEKRLIHKPVSYHLNVRGFVLVLAFLSPKHYFSSLLLFSYISFVHSFFEKFFNVFSCSKQNIGENILQISESLLVMTNAVNCCDDFL